MAPESIIRALVFTFEKQCAVTRCSVAMGVLLPVENVSLRFSSDSPRYSDVCRRDGRERNRERYI